MTERPGSTARDGFRLAELINELTSLSLSAPIHSPAAQHARHRLSVWDNCVEMDVSGRPAGAHSRAARFFLAVVAAALCGLLAGLSRPPISVSALEQIDGNNGVRRLGAQGGGNNCPADGTARLTNLASRTADGPRTQAARWS